MHPPLTIGRVAPSDLVLNGGDISRAHCRIVADGEGVAVSDLKSTNGTFLNDHRVAATTRLKPGDRLQVGSYVLVYQEQYSAAMADGGVEGTKSSRARGLRAGR